MTHSPPTASRRRAGGSLRDDPRFDRRRLVVYFAALVAFYALVVAIVRPGADDVADVAPGIMFAPTVGALAAWAFAHGRIRFGRLTWHLLLAFVPPVLILGVTSAAAGLGLVDIHPENLASLLVLSPVLALTGSVTALGEEIGWRGFLWPLLRRRTGFWAASAVMLPIWWLYHLPVILWWGYGFVGGIPAFTVGIAGFVLFVGVLTDRSRAIWPSVLAHGAWNGIVATAFVATLSGSATPACAGAQCPTPAPFDSDAGVFTGSATWLGEFGWIAAVTMLAIGLAAAWWHQRHPVDEPDLDAATETVGPA